MTDKTKDSPESPIITAELESPIERKTAGRPVTPLDEEKIKQFLSVGMSVNRISDYFNVTPKTIYNRFGTLVHHMNVNYDYELMMKQKELAMDGDSRMLIHLGKTHLKQSETVHVEANTNTKIEWVVETPKRPTPSEIVDPSDDEEEDEDDE